MAVEYKFIRAWCRRLRSQPYYVDEQIQLALSESAPERAIYRRKDGTWRTVDDCSPDVKEQLEQWVSQNY